MPESTTSHPRVRVDGKFFRLGEKKFHVKGVAYGPFALRETGDSFPTPEQASPGAELGEIRLHVHQRDAVAQCEALITRHGGALLADQVGLGKTFVALAIARAHGSAHAGAYRGALVVAPAALRATWARATARAGLSPLPFVSFEALSRGTAVLTSASLVIVDEAHHVRNPATRRHRAVAALGVERALLLLTATPVHNAPGDLASLIGLFLGARARRASLRELQSLVVRRTDAALPEAPKRPAVVFGARLAIPEADDLLDAIEAIPPALAPREGGRADALVTLGLVRAWASSDAALLGMLRRRLAMAAALSDALADGRHPTRNELAAWSTIDDAQQLAFPSLVTDAASRTEARAALGEVVGAHADGLRAVLSRITTVPSLRDDARAAHLHALIDGDAAQRVLAFTHSVATARALFSRLRGVRGVGLLTADGAEVVGGRLGRDHALARFAPLAQGGARPAERDAIRLLIATDVLAEGLNLQDATVVVHLDLPWTAARLEQRVGRVARPGSHHDTVRVLTMGWPAAAGRMTRVEQRLYAKLGAARELIGALPLGRLDAAPVTDDAPSAVELRDLVRLELSRWCASTADRVLDGRGAAASFMSPSLLVTPAGRWLAECGASDAHPACLVASRGGLATDAPADFLDVMRDIAGAARLATTSTGASVQLRRWQRHRDAASLAGVGAEGATASPVQRAALARLTALIATAPAVERALRAERAEAARRALSHAGNAQGDARLVRLAREHPDDDGWLTAIAALDGPSR